MESHSMWLRTWVAVAMACSLAAGAEQGKSGEEASWGGSGFSLKKNSPEALGADMGEFNSLDALKAKQQALLEGLRHPGQVGVGGFHLGHHRTPEEREAAHQKAVEEAAARKAAGPAATTAVAAAPAEEKAPELKFQQKLPGLDAPKDLSESPIMKLLKGAGKGALPKGFKLPSQSGALFKKHGEADSHSSGGKVDLFGGSSSSNGHGNDKGPKLKGIDNLKIPEFGNMKPPDFSHPLESVSAPHVNKGEIDENLPGIPKPGQPRGLPGMPGLVLPSQMEALKQKKSGAKDPFAALDNLPSFGAEAKNDFQARDAVTHMPLQASVAQPQMQQYQATAAAQPQAVQFQAPVAQPTMVAPQPAPMQVQVQQVSAPVLPQVMQMLNSPKLQYGKDGKSCMDVINEKLEKDPDSIAFTGKEAEKVNAVEKKIQELMLSEDFDKIGPLSKQLQGFKGLAKKMTVAQAKLKCALEQQDFNTVSELSAKLTSLRHSEEMEYPFKGVEFKKKDNKNMQAAPADPKNETSAKEPEGKEAPKISELKANTTASVSEKKAGDEIAAAAAEAAKAGVADALKAGEKKEGAALAAPQAAKPKKEELTTEEVRELPPVHTENYAPRFSLKQRGGPHKIPTRNNVMDWLTPQGEELGVVAESAGRDAAEAMPKPFRRHHHNLKPRVHHREEKAASLLEVEMDVNATQTQPATVALKEKPHFHRTFALHQKHTAEEKKLEALSEAQASQSNRAAMEQHKKWFMDRFPSMKYTADGEVADGEASHSAWAEQMRTLRQFNPTMSLHQRAALLEGEDADHEDAPKPAAAALAQQKTETNAAKMSANAKWLESHIPGLKYSVTGEAFEADDAPKSEWAETLKQLMNHPSSNELREQLHAMHV